MNAAELEAWKATWIKFEPITHQCPDCGADVIQRDNDIPPYVMYGPGWLCTDCKARRDVASEAKMHATGKASRAETARWEANDRWEESE